MKCYNNDISNRNDTIIYSNSPDKTEIKTREQAHHTSYLSIIFSFIYIKQISRGTEDIQRHRTCLMAYGRLMFKWNL